MVLNEVMQQMEPETVVTGWSTSGLCLVFSRLTWRECFKREGEGKGGRRFQVEAEEKGRRRFQVEAEGKGRR